VVNNTLEMDALGIQPLDLSKVIYNGFKKGLNDVGIIDLKIKKADFMKMEFDDLVQVTQKNTLLPMGLSIGSSFCYSACLVSCCSYFLYFL